MIPLQCNSTVPSPQRNAQRGRRFRRLSLVVSCTATLALSPLRADTVVSVDTTQTGGVFAVDPPILLITANGSMPTLTLESGATTSFTGATVVGGLSGEAGRLQILADSSGTSTGDKSLIHLYGSRPVYYGDGILGLNAGSHGEALVSGVNATWTVTTLQVGDAGTGDLTVQSKGLIVSESANIGIDTGSQGSVTITGSGSDWTNSGFLGIGFAGTGTLLLDGRARGSSGVTTLGVVQGGSGSVTISNRSQWETADIVVGGAGTGNLTVVERSIVSGGNATVGRGISNQGTVLVADSGSRWDLTGDLTVGVNGGTGTVRIEGSGFLGNQFATLGDTGHADVTLTNNSEWSIASNLIVGKQGTATLSVIDGSVVTSINAHIGSEAGSDGFMEIVGQGSQWTAEAVSVGFSGTGDLHISNGGLVTNSASYIGRAIGGNGAALVTGTNSTWGTSGDMHVGYQSVGQLDILDGGRVSNANATIGALAGGSGIVTVRDAGSDWATTGSLTIGSTNSVSGELVVDDNAVAHVSGTTFVMANGKLSVGSGNLYSSNIESAGEIQLNGGSLITPGGVTVLSGGIIGSTGIFDGFVSSDLTLEATASVRFSLTSSINVFGTVTLDSSFGVASLIGLDQNTPNGSYTIFGELPEGTHTDFAALGIQNWGINNAYDLGGGKSAYFREGSLMLEVIPEPGVMALVGLGVAGLFLRRRRNAGVF